MTEEELEARIQSFDTEKAKLVPLQYGRHAGDQASFNDTSLAYEHSSLSTYMFRLPKKWRKSRGNGVRVAILDSGVDLSHSCLKNSIAKHVDFTGKGVEDVHGHGSHVAGIIGAKGGHSGVHGVAPECELLIAKVLDNQGMGRCSDIAEGVDWAVDSGAHIIYLSMSSTNSSPLLYRSITYALAKGVHIVCAAGSIDSGSGESAGYPARYGSVISVSAIDSQTISQSISNADIVAPGRNIWSTFRLGAYQELSGSSIAAAFVTGIATLALASNLSASRSDTPIFNCEDLRAQLLGLAMKMNPQNSQEFVDKLPLFLLAGRSA